MKKDIAQKILLAEWSDLYQIIGYIVGLTVIGLLWAAFVAFVIGLFVTFPFTIVNVLKVYAALGVFNILTARFRK